jgi:DNA polymerase-4
LLEEWSAAHRNAPVRLLGVALSNLRTLQQPDLFADVPAAGSRLDAVVDGIRDRFGTAVLTRASLLPRGPVPGR